MSYLKQTLAYTHKQLTRVNRRLEGLLNGHGCAPRPPYVERLADAYETQWFGCPCVFALSTGRVGSMRGWPDRGTTVTSADAVRPVPPTSVAVNVTIVVPELMITVSGFSVPVSPSDQLPNIQPESGIALTMTVSPSI